MRSNLAMHPVSLQLLCFKEPRHDPASYDYTTCFSSCASTPAPEVTLPIPWHHPPHHLYYTPTMYQIILIAQPRSPALWGGDEYTLFQPQALYWYDGSLSSLYPAYLSNTYFLFIGVIYIYSSIKVWDQKCQGRKTMEYDSFDPPISDEKRYIPPVRTIDRHRGWPFSQG